MAHNINRNIKTGIDSFFSVKEKAWHNLGQIVEDYPTSAEAIKFAGLDYHVEKRPLFTYDNDSADGGTSQDGIQIPEIEIPNFYATLRTDTEQVLGVVGEKYHVVQNIDAFSFFDSIVGSDSGILYETAGALGNGQRIFITAKLPDYIRVGKKDLIEQYLFLTTSHDGSSSIMAAFTPVRIVCNNTLNMALRNHSNSVYIKHTASAKQQLNEAHKILGISNTLSEELNGLFNRWAKVRIKDKEIKKLIQLAMAPDMETYEAITKNASDFDFSKIFCNTVDEVLEYSLSADSQLMDTTAGTVFGAYNGITGYFQNVKEYKTADHKLNSIMFGGGLDRTKKAFQLCTRAADEYSDRNGRISLLN